MLADKIKFLRMQSGFSQSELARRLNVTRSSVNSWELGISTPTTQYIVECANIFHVSSDYILGLESDMKLDLSGFSQEEINILYSLVKYFDERKKDSNLKNK